MYWLIISTRTASALLRNMDNLTLTTIACIVPCRCQAWWDSRATDN